MFSPVCWPYMQGYRPQRDGYRARWVWESFSMAAVFLLLLNILVIALLSMPTPFRVFRTVRPIRW